MLLWVKRQKQTFQLLEDALPVVWTCSQVRNITGFQTPLFKSRSLKRSFAKKYQDSGCFQSGSQSNGGSRNKIIQGPCTTGAEDLAAERIIIAVHTGVFPRRFHYLRTKSFALKPFHEASVMKVIIYTAFALKFSGTLPEVHWILCSLHMCVRVKLMHTGSIWTGDWED